jgi:hypothetical protein
MKTSLLAAVLLCLLAFPVSAQQTGSLLIKNIYAPATLFRLADAQGEFAEDFSGVDSERLTQQTADAAAAKTFQKYAREKKLTGQEKTPNNAGQVCFEQLDEGYYLVCSLAEPGEFAPFILQIPMQVADKTIYDVQAEPKNEPPADPDNPSGPPPLRPVIPQTGFVQWPKYLLLGLGVAFVAAGLIEAFRGREKAHE